MTIDLAGRRTPPTWARDLVIYELNPRTFTTPAPPDQTSGSGTFASLQERLPYLADLGVNAIWIAGHSPSTRHFYGIKSVYACLRPDHVDPELGSEEGLRALTDAAHRLEIRVFLDVISHGVVAQSSLIAQHPDWFTGGTWGMSDYDYANPGFRRWWVDTWVRFAHELGVDGYRVDVSLIDPSIWDEITDRCAALGKQIAVFPENGRYHFSQQEFHGPAVDPVLDWSVTREFLDDRLIARMLSCHDRGWEGLPGNHYVARGSRAKLGYGLALNPQIPIFLAGEEFDAEPVPLAGLRQGLFGTGGPGGWMYGARLDWSQLAAPRHRAMFEDMRGYLRARSRYRHLLNADPTTGDMIRVAGDGAAALVPFARFRPGEEAVVVVGNELPRPVTFTLSLPLAAMGLTTEHLTVTDVIEGRTTTRTADELDDLRVDVGADYTPGGGVRVFHLSPSPWPATGS